MNIKHTAWITVAVAALMLLFAAIGAGQAQTEQELVWQEICAGRIVIEGEVVSCYEAAPAPTATPTAVPTDTPEPPPPPVDIDPYPAAPACDSHDDRAHHGLWNEEEGCHYDHVHADNPHELDYKLGTELYALMGGEISYPWQTVSAAGEENALKHEGYVWHVRDDIPCETDEPCITAFRALVHQHTIADAGVRFHSYVLEGQTSDGGYFLLGGHMDFGDLHAPEGTIVVDVDGNHCGSTANPGAHKQHAIRGGDRSPSNIWYGRSRTNSDVTVDRSCGFASIGVTAHDPWVWTTQQEPFEGDFVCYPFARCRVNATTFRPHLIGVIVNDLFPWIFEEGVTDFDGWADRYGVPYADGGGCTEPSIDCTPFVLQGLRVGQYRTHPSHTERSIRDYDVYFGGLPAGWAQPPGYEVPGG